MTASSPRPVRARDSPWRRCPATGWAPAGVPALHLGYAGVSEEALVQAVPKLARVMGLR